MSDDEFVEPKQGKKSTTKKVTKKDKYEALIVVIDCSPHMKKLESNGLSSFTCAKDAVDWILSRKVTFKIEKYRDFRFSPMRRIT